MARREAENSHLFWFQVLSYTTPVSVNSQLVSQCYPLAIRRHIVSKRVHTEGFLSFMSFPLDLKKDVKIHLQLIDECNL